MELDDVLKDDKQQAPPEQTTEAPPETTPPLENKSLRKQHQEREQAAQHPPAAEKEPEAAKERDEAGKFVAPKKDEPTEKERAYLAAATDERRKRQELERRLAELEAKPKAPVEPPKPFWDAPEEALSRIDQARQQDRAEIAAAMHNQRINFAEMMARSKYADYDEKLEVFKTMASTTPGLVQQCMSDPDPANFAYRAAKAHKDIQDAGSIDEYRARIEKETRIKLEAEYKKKHDDMVKERSSIPESLSSATGTSQHKVAWAGPPSLDNILHDK